MNVAPSTPAMTRGGTWADTHEPALEASPWFRIVATRIPAITTHGRRYRVASENARSCVLSPISEGATSTNELTMGSSGAAAGTARLLGDDRRRPRGRAEAGTYQRRSPRRKRGARWIRAAGYIAGAANLGRAPPLLEVGPSFCQAVPPAPARRGIERTDRPRRAGGSAGEVMVRTWIAAVDRVLFPGRLRALRVVLAAFVLFNALVRIALTLYERDVSLFAPWRLVPALLTGLVLHAGVASFFVAPLALLLLAWPARLEGALRHALAVVLLPLAALFAFVGGAELVFWNEFTSRFNFIAVDYLVYTNEVIGNLRESYDLPLAFGGVAAVALVLWVLLVRGVRKALAAPGAVGVRRAADAARAGRGERLP